MRKCDLGLLDFGMPFLFPLETVITSVAPRGQNFYGLFHRDVAAPHQHVAAIFLIAFRRARIFQMRVTDVAAELFKGLRRFFSRDAGVMRVPQESYVRV